MFLSAFQFLIFSNIIYSEFVLAEIVKQEMSLDELLAEKERRDQAKKHRSHINDVSDEELNERIAAMRNENRQ